MYHNISIELQDVCKKIGKKVLFEGITAKVKSGQCLAVTGPNGSGKSTLIKMIAGISKLTTGTIQVLIDGRQINIEEQMACQGLVSPEIIFYGDMTGRENIVFFTRARGLKCSLSLVEECCQTVGLTAYKDHLVHTYSTGMRQRLKFAVMLATKPLLWLLDEPASNLDADGKNLVSQMIVNALAGQAAVVIGTNEPWEAQHAGYKINLL